MYVVSHYVVSLSIIVTYVLKLLAHGVSKYIVFFCIHTI